jgi:KipI family sensor histidine kinase inhibitor
MRYVRILPAGGNAIMVELGDSIDRLTNLAVHDLAERLLSSGMVGVEEVIPSYRSLLVLYDPTTTDFDRLSAAIPHLCLDQNEPRYRVRRWQIPVVYGGFFGPDLTQVAKSKNLSDAELIELHAAREYHVYMLGFAPGFAYLGELPEQLQVSRKASNPVVIPAGSISIGGAQTAISTLAMPSAWSVIGCTPVRAFDPDRAEPFLFSPGDRVRITAIDSTAYDGFDSDQWLAKERARQQEEP